MCVLGGGLFLYVNQLNMNAIHYISCLSLHGLHEELTGGGGGIRIKSRMWGMQNILMVKEG